MAGLTLTPVAMAAAQVTATSLVVAPRPFMPAADVVLTEMLPGETLAAFLARHGIEGNRWAVAVGGIDVPAQCWRRVRVKPGQIIEARSVVRESALRIVSMIAIAVLAVYTGGLAAGLMGFTSGTLGFAVASGIVASVVTMAGSALINKLLPPPSARGPKAESQNPTYALQGGQNTARPYEPLTLVLGESKLVMDYASQPYTWFEGEDQYQSVMFAAGINCASYTDLKIGDTLIGEYQDVTVTETGFPGQPSATPATQMESVDSIAGALLEAKDSPGPYTLRTSSVGTARLAVDLSAQLFELSKSGNHKTAKCVVDLEYRLLPSGEWKPFGQTTAITLSNNKQAPLRKTIARDVPIGQYEVRARKVTADTNSTSASNQLSWDALKSYQPDKANYGGQPRIQIKIKASGQLNGALNAVSIVARAGAVPYWTGSAWTVAANPGADGISNPGAQILQLLRGIYRADGKLLAGCGLPDSRIDLESIRGFIQHCAKRGYRSDMVVQQGMSRGELLEAVAACGMGTISRPSGKWGVVWFADDQPIQGVVNMTNIKARTFSIGYDLLATADELQFEFFDPSRNWTWQPVRVKAPGVEMPQSTARTNLLGITSEKHAATLARFSMAQNIYGRKSIAWEMDLEYLTYRRGALVVLSHDLTQWGHGGRVLGISTAPASFTVALDDAVPTDTKPLRRLGIRLAGESIMRVFPVASVAANGRSITVGQAWPAGLPMPGSNGPAHDALWMFDFKETPGYRVRIVSITPSGQDSARITAVPESPEFWNFVNTGVYAPPPNNSLLTLNLPVVSGLQVTAEQIRQGDAWVTRLTATWDVAGNYLLAQLWAAPDGLPLERIGGSIYGARVSWDAQAGQVWSIEIRPFDTLGRQGTKAAISYSIAANAPVSVAGLALSVTDQGVIATWDAPDGLAAVDWSLTELHKGETWETGKTIFSGRATNTNLGWLKSGTTTVWCASRNSAGMWSAPVSAAINIKPPDQPIVTGDAQGKQVQIAWQDCRTTQPLEHYVISVGSTQSNAVLLGYSGSTVYSVQEQSAGKRRYWVVAKDKGGNTSAGGYVEVISLPDIDEAMAVLQEGLDETLSLIMDPETGLPGTDKKLADAMAAEQLARAQDIAAEATARAQGLAAEAAARAKDITEETANRVQAVAAEAAARAQDIADEAANRVQAVAAEALARAQAIANEALARAQALAGEGDARASAIAAMAAQLQAQINTLNAQLVDILGAEKYDPDAVYPAGNLAVFEGKLYRAKQNTVGNPPTNTTYWDLVGEYASLGDAVVAQAAHLQEIASKVEQTGADLSALSAAQLALAAKVDNNTAGLVAEQQARATADSAQAQSISAMQTRMPTGTGTLATSADVVAETAARVAADNAQSSSIAAFSASLGATQSDVDKARARVDAAIAQAVNAVLDPSFESNPTVWALGGRFSITTAESHTGTRCLEVAPSTAALNSLFGAKVNVQPGQVWRIKAWRKTTLNYNGTSGNGKLRVGDATGALLTAYTWGVGNTWAPVGADYTVPAGVTALNVQMVFDHTVGTLWIDDVEVADVTEIVAANAAAAAAQAAADKAQATADTKASASALAATDAKVTRIDGDVTSQSGQLVSLSNSLATTNANVATAQSAAQAANDLAGGKGKVIYGNAAPTVADRQAQNLWIDTTNNANTPKRWNGAAWVTVTDKVATDAAAAAAAAQASANSKADASALSALDSTVRQQGDTLTTHGSSIIKISGSIDSLKANSPNAVFDGGFEQDGTWTLNTGWSIVAGAGRNGTRAAVRVGVATGAFYPIRPNVGTVGVPVSPGQKWRARAYYKSSADLNGDNRVRLGDQSDTALSAAYFSAGKNDWVDTTVIYTVPATGVTALTLSVLSNNTAGTLTVNDVELTNVTDIEDVRVAGTANASALAAMDAKVRQQGDNITSQSGQLLSLTNSLTAAQSGPANLLWEPTFNAAGAGWFFTPAASIVTVADAPGGVSRPVLRITALTADDAAAPNAAFGTHGAGKPVPGGATFSLWMRARLVSGAAGNLTFRMGAFRTGQANQWPRMTQTLNAATATPGAWVEVKGTLTSPANTDRASISLHCAGAAGTVFEVADVSANIIDPTRASADELAATSAALKSTQSTVEQQGSAITAHTSDLTSLKSRMPTGTGTLATEASVTAEASTRAAVDAAQASDISAMKARMPTGTDKLITEASVITKTDTLAATDSAQASQISAMQARMPAGTGTLATNADLVSKTDALANADSAHAGQLASMSASLGATQSDVDKARARVDAAIAQAVNAVLDPSFESNPTVWALGGRFSITTAESHTGTRCLEVAPSTAALNSLFGAKVNVQPGQVWRIKAWRKTTLNYNGTSGNGKLRVGDATGALLTAYTWGVGNTWAPVGADYTVPAGVTALNVQMVFDHTVGTLWIDDVEVADVTEIVAANAAAAAAQAAADKAQATADTKASASALAATDAKVTRIDGDVTSQSGQLVSLSNSLATTNANVATAQSAAQAANDLAGGKGKVIYGNAAPTVADRQAQNLWIDTTNNANTPKRWNGAAWVTVTDKVATDAAAAAAAAQASANSKADASALSALDSTVRQQGDTLTTHGSSIIKISGSIDSLKANSPNAVFDGGFEQDGTWTLNTGWSIVAGAGRNGTRAAVRVGVATGAFYPIRPNVGTVGVPVSPGQKWRARAYYKSSADLNGDNRVRLGDQSDTALSAAYFSAGKNDWVDTTVIYTVPATGVTALTLSVLSNNTAGTLTVNDVELTNVTDIEDVRVAGTANASALAAMDSRVKTAEDLISSHAGSLTSINTSLGSAGSQNLLPNPSFDVYTGATGAPDLWALDGFAAATYSIVPSTLSGSTSAWRFDAAAPNANQYRGLVTPNAAARLNVVEGRTYTLSAHARGGNATFALYIQWVNAAGTAISTPSVTGKALSATAYARYSVTATAPAGAVKATLYTGRFVVVTAGSAMWGELDNAQFEEGSIATGWRANIAETTSAAITAMQASVTKQGGDITAQSSSLNSLTSTVNGHTASITQYSTTLASINGQLAATASLSLTAGKKIGGWVYNNTGTVTSFVVLTDKFAVAQNDGAASTYPFIVGSVNGISTTGINGALVVDGSILAKAIDTRGLTIKDASGNVILGAGGLLSGSYISSLSANKVTGLGALATASDVRIGSTLKFPDGSTVNQADLVSKLSKINSGNIGTFMDGAAITNAYIGNAAVGTLQVAGGAVTAMRYSNGGAAAIAGSAGAQTLINSITIPVQSGATGIVFTGICTAVSSVSGQGAAYSLVVRRGGSDIANRFGSTQGGIWSVNAVTCFDNPGAGTFTYELWGVCEREYGTGSYHGVSITSSSFTATGGQR